MDELLSQVLPVFAAEVQEQVARMTTALLKSEAEPELQAQEIDHGSLVLPLHHHLVFLRAAEATAPTLLDALQQRRLNINRQAWSW